ncbi:MAG: hypothetical protein KDD82_03775, partial [Planctomycetes bacterium]|nr:hypothetical protein [Planctomycetota bacterium]
MRVMKFGGSCLQDGSGLPQVVARVRAAGPPLCVVVSAFKGVTDQLRDLAHAAAAGASPDLTLLTRAHARLLEGLGPEARATGEPALAALLRELEGTLSEVRAQGATPPRLDRVLGWGERACAQPALAHLAQAGVDAELRVGAA